MPSPGSDAAERDFAQDATAVLEQPNIEHFTALAGDTGTLNLPEVVKETKEGYKTTEFWATVVSGITVASGIVPTPHNTKGFALVALVAIYCIARGLAKKGVPVVEPVVVPEQVPSAGD